MIRLADLIFRLAVVAVSGTGSVIALLRIKHPRGLAPVLVSLLLVAVVLVAISEIRAWRAGRPKRCPTEKDIQDFMVSWISNEGRVAIYTRDMSWARETNVSDLLRAKATRSELVICLPHHIPLTRDLEALGAQIHTYENLEYDPQSRFTIIRFGRADASVAIGRQIDGIHTIETYSAGHHPVFALAEDLVEIARRAE